VYNFCWIGWINVLRMCSQCSLKSTCVMWMSSVGTFSYPPANRASWKIDCVCFCKGKNCCSVYIMCWAGPLVECFHEIDEIFGEFIGNHWKPEDIGTWLEEKQAKLSKELVSWLVSYLLKSCIWVESFVVIRVDVSSFPILMIDFNRNEIAFF